MDSVSATMALIALPLTFVLFSREKTSKVSTTNLREGQLNLVGEEFNDTVITVVRTGGLICRDEQRKWELCRIHVHHDLRAGG